MNRAHSMLFLIILAGVCPNHVNCWCLTDALLAGGAVGAGVVAAPFVASAALGAVGFTAAGTAAGSAGAALMSTYGGSIAAGSAVSVMQSVGAAGLGVAGQAVGGAVAGAAAYAAGGGNCDPKSPNC
ncbi:interferon alpha-inducible protein 27-like protein 1 [Pecten maximus]|uniref:interferon alpha-inducible protein 27-like protein 1 n=1 Tax=Pecten maximus TaxID=6579 RepID=UPI001458B5A5|nr:interferon alpha-inducible protein 27-like protein 1 [Pecten maximus]XP_033763229.1 interferon alpha-inducible protein 27-like protein 1 [Pecten maximus]XP_033763238.1 interferon alpha-inducible protein 27-like protein 1 [Pecten maximus]